MQHVMFKTKPESNRKFLVQQVEEQSVLCNMTVKMGHWEKKFHRCVLVVSPFLDRVLNSNFLEKQTGKIEMTVGTPLTLEMAIMFLYGKRPNLTQENIEHMMALAEFLLIPNLKSACISWLKTVTITEENCMNLLQLSSIYNFEIPSCEEYIMGHMIEMFHHAQMVNLCKDSVQYLFTNRKLSFVHMDDKARFLTRWSNNQPERRKTYLREMFEMIDFHEISKVVLDELKTNQDVSDVIDFEKIPKNEEIEIAHSHRVLIMKGEGYYGTYWCLDLKREKWFGLKPENREGRTYGYSQISGARNVCSEIYFTQRYRQADVLILNLEADVCKTYKLVQEDNGDALKEFGDVCLMGDICIAYVNELLNSKKEPRKSFFNPIMERKMFLPFMESASRYTKTSTLYIGHIHAEEKCIKMSPLLTFKDNTISKICISKMLTVAVILGSMKVVSLFDLVDYRVETIQLKTECMYNDKLVQTDDGFMIYNNRRCICLSKITRPCLSLKFQTKEISIENEELYRENKYFFCRDTWYHYYCRKSEEHFMFESASHNDVISKRSLEDVAWKRLPLPKDDTRGYSVTLAESNKFQICLPKSKLRCDIECPHCKLKPEGTTRRTLSDDSDSDDSASDESRSSQDYFYSDSFGDYYSRPSSSGDDYGYNFESDHSYD